VLEMNTAREYQVAGGCRALTSLKLPSTYRTIMLVLPALASPRRATFTITFVISLDAFVALVLAVVFVLEDDVVDEVEAPTVEAPSSPPLEVYELIEKTSRR
jgi:hypothetical protein